jgi:predicted enzyme related to lactoylglutathione lyase
MTRATSNPVVHLELHTGSLSRARQFYTRLLGWRSETIETGNGDYLGLDLGDRLGGGIVECGTSRGLWLPYVEVDGIAEATEEARGLGARVLLEPREGPAGWRSVISAPEGGELALWQQKEHER